MSAAHTPGPWVVGDSDCSGVFVSSDGGNGPIVHSQNYYNEDELDLDTGSDTPIDDKEVFANGRLIAAAPELLAVVKELEESAGYWGEYDVPVGIVGRLRAAIAKATGVKA